MYIPGIKGHIVNLPFKKTKELIVRTFIDIRNMEADGRLYVHRSFVITFQKLKILQLDVRYVKNNNFIII